MNDLLKQWRSVYDDKEAATAEIRAEIEALQNDLAEISVPFDAQLSAWEEAIREEALELAETYKAEDIGVVVSYRKGSTRITYDWRKVDSVRDFLRDVLPETAESLNQARKQTEGAPSVSIKPL